MSSADSCCRTEEDQHKKYSRVSPWGGRTLSLVHMKHSAAAKQTWIGGY